MAYQVMLMFLVVSTMTTGTWGQSPQQDNQQQSGHCICPCNSVLTVPAGPPGPTGLPGVQGPQGATGPAGNPGSHGSHAIPGSKGEKGDLGQGSKGQAGDPGPKGEQGLAGEPGPRGSPGNVGPQGIVGRQGPEGNAGQSGVKGEKGDTAPPMSASAFSARKTVNRESSSSETVTFEVEDFDVGNDFNPSTGVFTCRIQGLYYFSFSFLPFPTFSFYVYLDQNGSHKAKIHCIAGRRRLMQSQSVTLSLQVGDEVKLTSEAPSEIGDSDDITNVFNGYLIHAT